MGDMLKLVVQEQAHPDPGESPQECLVVKEFPNSPLPDIVLGRLPIAYANYTMRPNQPNVLTIDLFVEKARIEGHT